LLRVLESGEVRGVGENDPFRVDVRIVCATHRDFAEMVADESFRADLMFRINTFEVRLPSLRERRSDIAMLAGHLLKRFQPMAHGENGFDRSALETLQNYDWPGNVRELANVIEHATILCDSLPIRVEHLPSSLTAPRALSVVGGGITLREIELQAIRQAIQRHAGSKPKAAEALGISLKTLYNKLNQAQALEKTA